ncbi:MAG: RNA polymerase factor sigma-32 [Hyphomicrobiales bacterium]|nr:RNA polymerase factor sigma-32 [Hyphomicrobiales bacterium]MBV8427358.1 RNA polymerase factor sigma-32 [Hyphomicrobiales bacterium]MBV9431552.1 RNA polymerase factor sigma-32 [Hyphomicrobiales bacterium]MBV9739430.1 RNA polymerase factor sigma-32 [Hyphomicrobiales bacterium]MBW0005781.1 RNA polymerase factor sigma-32 [Hyphomicrobiales bacterium]
MSDLEGIHKQVIRAAMSAPYLQREEEHELALRWSEEGDEVALHQLVSSHIRLVIAIASRFRRYGLPLADMIQEGHVGLLEAAARFEPERGVRFSTYVTWWIRASIQDYVLRNWSIVRGGTSSAQKSLFFNLRRLRAKLGQKMDKLSASELHQRIAQTVGVSCDDVETMEARLSGSDLSLNVPVPGEETENASDRQDFLVDRNPLPDEIVAETIDSGRRAHWLHHAMTMLSERERLIIEARRLHDDDLVTLETVGRRLGISKERVRQIENRALDKLKKALQSNRGDMLVAA